MRKFTGEIATNKVGSSCKFSFEVDDDVTEEQIEEYAKEIAFEYIDWNFSEDK